ncbi:protease complex subunit PrcB family protein [Micromonospora cremea]|uniref:PrcB C-terminal n=1 Tax=Micromonospora cremea TaxID=709881 RepID=A0A1N6A9Q4_9ACTN|nr:protease complex subunit PrcB family protein [Micromonospora cremea]SIN30761.1 PrcB C-terminal [Micromonospora cremea]
MRRLLGMAMVMAISMAGCTGSDGEPVGFRALADDDVSDAHVAGLFVVRTQPEWEQRWQGLMAMRGQPSAPPAVDWTTEMVIFYVLGTRPSGGYSVRIDEISKRDGRLTVRVEESRPGGSCSAADVLTNPFHAVATPASDASVEVDLDADTHRCK